MIRRRYETLNPSSALGLGQAPPLPDTAVSKTRANLAILGAAIVSAAAGSFFGKRDPLHGAVAGLVVGAATALVVVGRPSSDTA